MNAGGNNRPPLADLPEALMEMFAPPPPLVYKPPIIKNKMPPYSGLAAFLTFTTSDDKTSNKTTIFASKEENEAYRAQELKKKESFLTTLQRKKQIKQQMINLHREKNELLVAEYDPHNNPNSTKNAFTTLFVWNISYDTTEKKLRREFEQYGTIEELKMIKNLEKQPRGYAFIQFSSEEEMTMAYKRADGKKIDGRRVNVDVERGRTVRNWKPTRLGGGLGGRKAKKSKKQLAEEGAEVEIPRMGLRDMGSERDRRGSSRDRRDRGNSRDRRDRGDRRRVDSRDRRGGDRYGGKRARSRSRDRGGDRSRRRGSSRDRGNERGYDRGNDRGRTTEIPPPTHYGHR